jgi:hypothetical protein
MNISTQNFIKQILLYIKAQIQPNTITLDDFNTPLSPIDRSSGPPPPKKISKETSELNDIIDQWT